MSVGASFFELRIGRRGDDCFARVEHPDFEAEVDLRVDDLFTELGEVVAEDTRLRQLSPPAEGPLAALRERADTLGRALGRQLFREPMGSGFERFRAAAKAQGRRLVVRLRFDPEPRLLVYPWEVVFGPGGRKPLAINDELPLVRTLPLPWTAADSPTPSRLRVLIVVAQAADFAPLDSTAETEKLKVALTAGASWLPIDSQLLAHATPAALRQAVAAFRPHVVHFIGHGAARSEGGEACLVLEREHGGSELVDGQQLSALLGLTAATAGVSRPRLVVLNACSTAEVRSGDALAGVAQRLLQQGLPSVVAMRYAVTDIAAICFAEHLYRELAAGSTIEQAMSRARNILYGQFSDLSWLAPVLFLRGESRPLVRPRSRFGRIALAAAGVVVLGSLALWSSLRQPPPTPRPLPAEVLADHPRCPSPKGVTLGLQFIEPGSFEMGQDGSRDTAPRHTVHLSQPFCLGRTEVTREQWERVMGDAAIRQGLLSWSKDGRLPKSGVSYEEALAFVRQLNKLTGEEAFSLPSEAEWEYAARAGGAGAYSFGDDVTLLARYANCGPKSRDPFSEVAPVASLAANGWGIYDMQGNVTEWVSDRWASYQPGQQTDPRGASTGDKRIRRGGSFLSALDNCRPSHRIVAEPDFRGEEFGLRVRRKALP